MAERTIVTKVTNAILYSDGCMRIDGVRLSFPYVAEPRENVGDDGVKKKAFETTALLPKDSHKAAKDLVKKVIIQIMAEAGVKVASEFWCLKDGDAVEAAAKAAKAADPDADDYDPDTDESPLEHRKHFTIKAAEKSRPAVRNRQGGIMSQAEVESEIYGGCWANVLIRLWYFNGKAKNGKSYPKRILANLIAVQKVRDDEPFGEGRVSDEGIFGPVEGEDEGGFSSNDSDAL